MAGALEYCAPQTPPLETSPPRTGTPLRWVRRRARRSSSFPETLPSMIPAPPYRRRARPLALVLGALLALVLLVPAAPAAAADYSGWSVFLHKYLMVLREQGKPWDSRFDYEQLYVDEGIWTKHRSDALSALRSEEPT